MGKRRKAAKTGDKALYKSRVGRISSGRSGKSEKDDDLMFDEVHRYNNQQEDFIDLKPGEESDSTDDGVTKQESILDLGVRDESSSSDDDDDSHDEIDDEHLEANQKSVRKDPESDSENSGMTSDSENEIDIKKELGDIRDWGRSKSAYYHGDTADLEIGQDQQDAFDEEEAAKEIQKARLERMDEEDFLMSDDELESGEKETKSGSTDASRIEITRNLANLTRPQRLKLLESHHPELMPLVGHFSLSLDDWMGQTSVVTKALLQSDEEGTPEAVGATPEGIEYILTKSMLQASTALNFVVYLLLKIEQARKRKGMSQEEAAAAIEAHPVMERLMKLNTLSRNLETTLESHVDNLSEQIESLVKASALMSSGDNSDDSSEQGESDAEASQLVEADTKVNGESSIAKDLDEDDVDGVMGVNNDDDSYEEDEDADVANSAWNEARFGMRAHEVSLPTNVRQRRPAQLEYGDEEIDTSRSRTANKSLSSTINTIEQRSASRKRKTKAIESLDSDLGEDKALRSALDMMENELGPASEDEEADSGPDDSMAEERDGIDFYALTEKKAKMKKDLKKSMYEVAPKYPGLEEEIDGERAISRQILKNRGLVAHKSKLNRNPRVQKREKYRKAIIRRKGKVREVRTDEAHKYGGEQTGIKSRLSRSRKLAGK